MDTIQCINSRRSIRGYTAQPVDKETVRELITLGTQAATGSGLEPWGFLVLQDKEELERLSTDIVQYNLENLDRLTHLQRYQKMLSQEDFRLFYGASTVIAIYGDTTSHWHQVDCTLAASNIMLGAHAKGLGTCWIGFAHEWFKMPKFKAEHNIPDTYELVCVMSLGYPAKEMPPRSRKEALLFTGL